MITCIREWIGSISNSNDCNWWSFLRPFCRCIRAESIIFLREEWNWCWNCLKYKFAVDLVCRNSGGFCLLLDSWWQFIALSEENSNSSGFWDSIKQLEWSLCSPFTAKRLWRNSVGLWTFKPDIFPTNVVTWGPFWKI